MDTNTITPNGQWKAFKRLSIAGRVNCSSPLLPNMRNNKKQETNELSVQCLPNPNRHSITRQFCRDISGMWQCIMHGQKYRSAHKKCLHMPLSAANMEPDAALFANRKLFKPEGLLGYLGVAGRGGLCVCFKGRWGLPQMSVPQSQHSTPQHHRLAPDLYPLTPAGPKQWGCSKQYIKLAYVVS